MARQFRILNLPNQYPVQLNVVYDPNPATAAILHNPDAEQVGVPSAQGTGVSNDCRLHNQIVIGIVRHDPLGECECDHLGRRSETVDVCLNPLVGQAPSRLEARIRKDARNLSQNECGDQQAVRFLEHTPKQSAGESVGVSGGTNQNVAIEDDPHYRGRLRTCWLASSIKASSSSGGMWLALAAMRSKSPIKS
jgi:hypothetical protein